MGLNIYKIRDMAIKNKRAVYSTQMLANLIGKKKNITTVYLNRIVQKGLAKKIMRGKISFRDDEYIIASQLVEPAYISLNSALLKHGLIRQIPNSVECVTTKNSINYDKLKIKYFKIPPELLYGYKKYSQSQTYIFLAEPEKAIIDSIYLNKITKNMVLELLDKIDRKKLDKYAKRFSSRGSKKIRRWINAQ